MTDAVKKLSIEKLPRSLQDTIWSALKLSDSSSSRRPKQVSETWKVKSMTPDIDHTKMVNPIYGLIISNCIL